MRTTSKPNMTFIAMMRSSTIRSRVSESAAGGTFSFRGPLNRYRTSELDFAQQAEIADCRIEQPAAFIAGSLDPVLGFLPGVDLVALMRERVTDLRLVRIIDGAGHWVQQEHPAEVNTALLEFLGGLA